MENIKKISLAALIYATGQITKKFLNMPLIGKYGNIVEVCPFTKALAKARKNLLPVLPFLVVCCPAIFIWRPDMMN